jgi:hypothetical protein
MTRDELYQILRNYVGRDAEALHAVGEIWGQPFDGETEKIAIRADMSTKSVSSTSPATEQSSATLTESFRDGTTYTRSYQVFLPTPTPTQPQ